MPQTVLVMIACAMLSAGCLQRQTVIPDPGIAHRVAKPAKVTVWVRRSDGRLVQETIRLESGWVCASPQVVERPAK